MRGLPRWCEACVYVYAAAESLQSCPTLCDSIDGSPPGSTIPGILQARTLEWVAISFSNVYVYMCVYMYVYLCVYMCIYMCICIFLGGSECILCEIRF